MDDQRNCFFVLARSEGELTAGKSEISSLCSSAATYGIVNAQDLVGCTVALDPKEKVGSFQNTQRAGLELDSAGCRTWFIQESCNTEPGPLINVGEIASNKYSAICIEGEIGNH